MVTDTLIKLQPERIPDTVTLFETPTGLLSGTGILTGPEQNCDVTGRDASLSFTAGSPRHILTEAGVTTGAGGV